jgi:hypothetical protein
MDNRCVRGQLWIAFRDQPQVGRERPAGVCASVANVTSTTSGLKKGGTIMPRRKTRNLIVREAAGMRKLARPE